MTDYEDSPAASDRDQYSRDFTLLIGSALVLLVLLLSWVAYDALKGYENARRGDLVTQINRLDRMLQMDLQQSSFLLESLGRQIVHSRGSTATEIAQILRAFASEKSLYSVFGWISPNQKLIVSSDRGVLTRGVDVSDRDYVKKALVEPWVVQLGRPISGRLSGNYVMPLALGVEDYTGEYLGTVMVSINAENFMQRLKRELTDNSLHPALITQSFSPIFVDSQGRGFSEFLQGRGVESLSDSSGTFWINAQQQGTYQRAASYPLTLLLATDAALLWGEFLPILWQRIIPVLLVALFMGMVLWLIRRRIAHPLNYLNTKVEELIRGRHYSADIEGWGQIEQLDKQISRIHSYLTERRNVEREQRSKLTFMKQSKEAAELSNQVKIDFLNSMSHELRTPLNTIVGFAELMKNEVYGTIGNEKYLQYIDDIYECSNAVQGLVGDVLALAKAEAGLLELQEKPVQAEQVIIKCIRVLSGRLRETGVTIENRVKDTLPKLLVDELRLKQIILNLLGNAISHSGRSGVVTVDIESGRDARNERYFDIIVTDTGSKRRKDIATSTPRSIREEMDTEGRPRLRSRSQLGRISNLGIPLTRALVAMHQATLTMETTPGKETRVIVRFPAERIV